MQFDHKNFVLFNIENNIQAINDNDNFILLLWYRL